MLSLRGIAEGGRHGPIEDRLKPRPSGQGVPKDIPYGLFTG